jgi:hypothetical protein
MVQSAFTQLFPSFIVNLAFRLAGFQLVGLIACPLASTFIRLTINQPLQIFKCFYQGLCFFQALVILALRI